MPATPIPLDELAARLSARFIHDAAGHASILTTGLDVLALADDEATRAEAAGLLKAGLSGLIASLDFYRQAFGRGEADVPTAELETRARGLFADVRPTLDWAVAAPALAAPIARAATILAQIASEVLAVGGVARIAADGAGRHLSVVASGPRARLNAESRAGLLGEPAGGGPGGRWIQAFILHAQIATAGGALNITESEGEVIFDVSLPAAG